MVMMKCAASTIKALSSQMKMASVTMPKGDVRMTDHISREATKLALVEAAQSRENGFQWGKTATFTTSKIK